MTTGRAIEVRTEPDGAVFLVGGWPERTTISESVLANPNNARIRRDGDRIIVVLDDGSAVYRITEHDEAQAEYRCVRES